MNEDLSEYKDLYIETAKEYMQSLNASLLKLEKNPEDKDAIAATFLAAHSLKSQSAAMGYEQIGFLCHTIEDIFYEIKSSRLQCTSEIADLLFQAFDSITKSLQAIETTGKETDLSSLTQKLKELTGVKTTGSGKSVRVEETKDQKTPLTPSKEIKTPQKEKEEVKSSDTQKPIVQNTTVKPDVTQTRTVSVKIEYIDAMVNLIEELIIYRLKLKKIAKELKNKELQLFYDQTERIVENLQFHIMKTRTIPVSSVFAYLPRSMRDAARQENKQVEMIINGDDVELDRTIVDKLNEPLIHIIRNAVSHGIEKSGTITINAEQGKDHALISVSDNGIGIDWETIAKKTKTDILNKEALKQALFSGVSTTEKVTQVSGRGVGLLAVKQMVDGFGGIIDVLSEKGKGTTFVLKIPLTLAITQVLFVQLKDRQYAIPTSVVERTLIIPTEAIQTSANQQVYILEGKEIPLLSLSTIFDVNAIPNSVKNENLVVIVVSKNQRIGLIVDAITETSEILMKTMPDVLKGNKLFSGTTIMGDGTSALVFNTDGITYI